MPSRLTIHQRAHLAILLSAGFYALALGVCLLLASIIWLQIVTAHLIPAILIACGGGIVVILKGVFPQPDKFQPPGPQLVPGEHPHLFALIRRMASVTCQSEPADVYLILDANAWVTELSDWREGPSRRRIMGIGLPVLETLTIGEFTAILAHEFGHYEAGDTKFGPVIYKTRTAIIRTLHGLAHRKSALTEIFGRYGRAYIRFTQGVSREQELVADRLAARVAGADVAVSALQKLARAAAAFPAYMRSEVSSVIDARYLPPIAEGFRRFMDSPLVKHDVDRVFDEQLSRAETDPFDSHPALRERVAALKALPPASDGAQRDANHDEPALGLLADVHLAESALLAQLIQDPAHRHLTPIAWEAVPAAVYPQRWAQIIEPARARLVALTPEGIAFLASSTGDKPDTIAEFFGVRLPDEAQMDAATAAAQRARIANTVLSCGVALALYRRSQHPDSGITLHAPVGDAVTFRIDDDTIRPFEVIADLSSGALAKDDWLHLCAAAGLARLDLAEPTDAPAIAIAS